MPQIGAMTPEVLTWEDEIYLPGYNAGDPLNRNPRISLETVRTATATFEGKKLGTGTVLDEGVDHTTNYRNGTAGALVTAIERGDSSRHKSILTLASFAVGTSGDNASLGFGAAFYTFPAGAIVVHHAYVAVGLTLNNAVQTDTPELGIGTVVASGAVAVLGGTATFENIFEGTAVVNVAGQTLTGFKGPTAGVPFLIGASDPRALYLNVADGWADISGPSALAASGFIVLMWDFIVG